MPKVLVVGRQQMSDFFQRVVQEGIRTSINGTDDVDRFIEEHYLSTRSYP
jgi:hypothetical protein